MLQPTPTPPLLAAYVDTCVVSARVKDELQERERIAVDRMIALFLARFIALARSRHVEEEIAAIPDAYRAPHEALLSTFLSVPSVEVGGLTRLTGMGISGANPRRMLWNRLERILKDEGDRWHVFTASQNRMRYLVTVDQRTILNHQIEIQAASGVLPLLPSAFIKTLDPVAPRDDA